MFINEETALKIVKLNNLQCCARCKFYQCKDNYIEIYWYCEKRGDIELDESPWIEVFKRNDCCEYMDSGK